MDQHLSTRFERHLGAVSTGDRDHTTQSEGLVHDQVSLFKVSRDGIFCGLIGVGSFDQLRPRQKFGYAAHPWFLAAGLVEAHLVDGFAGQTDRFRWFRRLEGVDLMEGQAATFTTPAVHLIIDLQAREGFLFGRRWCCVSYAFFSSRDL